MAASVAWAVLFIHFARDALLTKIPFSFGRAEPHQHRSVHEVKGNVLIPLASGYTLTVKKKKEIKRAYRLGQITRYCIWQTRQIECWQKKIILTLKVIVATVTFLCHRCLQGQYKYGRCQRVLAEKSCFTCKRLKYFMKRFSAAIYSTGPPLSSCFSHVSRSTRTKEATRNSKYPTCFRCFYALFGWLFNMFLSGKIYIIKVFSIKTSHTDAGGGHAVSWRTPLILLFQPLSSCPQKQFFPAAVLTLMSPHCWGI